MPVSANGFAGKLLFYVFCLSLMCFCGTAMAQRGSGERGPGARGRPGAPARQPVQQKPGKPAEDRFLRVCRVLSLSEEQMERAKAVYDSMGVRKSAIIEEQQSGAVDSLEARRKLSEVSTEFEADYISLLDEEQRKRLDKLKADGILENEWW